ncbi:ABC transporter ATP-binding protein [Tumebacillus permanentifrigoris]|uniref:Amino acid/amide ABC transporter ATP-binding protein 2 (HAAT family) n=1 Tax=Tumebacillus permanentifrigoris TaxID=378543 RepID=A0A316DC41_9BACL|nr:ABC transporter ATP-binding protein [Tumebacillus permanentifrigoris]PWK15707.1 amino acid/amide ABC transporter ATP-binding protein 2 (HAAT family) [Tumebacillus permanentifrigoris]
MTLLQVENIQTYIDQFHILQGVNLAVEAGRVTVILGRNGAGKTTTLRSIMGLTPPRAGRVVFDGRDIQGMQAHTIARLGIGYVPEDQGIFKDLTVEENMKLAIRKADTATQERQEFALELFPDLKIAWKRKGGNLSGGQKQMLSIARAFVNDNKLLLIDEPSKGLAPIVVEKVMAAILELKKRTTIVLVEQNFIMASGVGDDVYILDDGHTVYQGTMADIRGDEELKKKYLGIAI